MTRPSSDVTMDGVSNPSIAAIMKMTAKITRMRQTVVSRIFFKKINKFQGLNCKICLCLYFMLKLLLDAGIKSQNIFAEFIFLHVVAFQTFSYH